MSQKSERLVNLTIALLTSRRYLTKAEIFQKVEGYDGDADARDRMFERDKDELRSIGITIDVGQIDIFFEDEIGYRINRDTYKSQLPELSSQELTLLSLSQRNFSSHALGESSQQSLVKLAASGISLDEDVLPSIFENSVEVPIHTAAIMQAIAEKRYISFSYLNEELETITRKIAPYSLYSRSTYWYLRGLDLDKNEIRTFRLDRIDSEVVADKKSQQFVIPSKNLDGVEANNRPFTCTLMIRKDKAHKLRAQSVLIEEGSDWDTLTIEYFNLPTLLEAILWEGVNVKVLEPLTVREAVINSLAQVVKLHG